MPVAIQTCNTNFFMSDADEIRKINAPIKHPKPMIAVTKLVGPFLGAEKMIATQHPAMNVLMQP